MSLWTPDGEHEVPRDQPASTPAAEEMSSGIPGAPSLDDLSPEERAQAEAMAAELAEARERLPTHHRRWWSRTMRWASTN